MEKKNFFMKKNLLILSIFLSVSLILFSPVFCQKATLSVYPSSVTSTEGFTININVNGVTDLYAFQFKLGYDTNILDAIAVNVGPFLNEPLVGVKAEIDHLNGIVWVADTSWYPAAPKSGTGTLATITFQVTGSGSCALNLYDTMLPTHFPDKIPHVVNDGYFSSTGTACRADIKVDGIVDVFDAITLALAFGSGPECIPPDMVNWNPVADINNDGCVDIYDALILGGEFGREDC